MPAAVPPPEDVLSGLSSLPPVPGRLRAEPPGWTTEVDVVVVGSGIAGLTAALECRDLGRVIVVTKDELAAGSTHWAQGGIASVQGVGDTVEQHVHDTLIAACDVHRYAQLGHQGYHDNCTDNLRLALAALGLAPGEVPCPLNLWMNTPADAAGGIRWLPPASRPGDRVTFRAELDAVVVVSACPMDLLPINGEAGVIRPLGIERLD